MIVTETGLQQAASMPDEGAKGRSDATQCILPPQADDTVRAVAEMHAEHHRQSLRIDHAIDRLTAVLGSAAALGFLTLLVVFWVGINGILPWIGSKAFDAPPYPLLMDG